MSEIKLNLQARQMLYDALYDAFKTRAAIEELTLLSLGKTIDHFDAQGTGTRSYIMAIVNHCEAHAGNTLYLVIEVALELRPYHLDLHKIAAQLGVKSSGAKLARRPTRSSASVKSDDIDLAVRRLRNNYPEIDSFDMQTWQEILATLNIEFSMASTSGNLNRQRFPKLVSEMLLQNRLQELESTLKRAAIRQSDEGKKRNIIINDFNNAYQQADWDRVINLSENLEKLSAHNPATRRSASQAYKKRGTWHHEKRNYPPAIMCFTQAIYYSTRASQASCYYLRGRVYFDQGEYTKALDDFDQALQRDSSIASYNYWQGRCYQAQAAYDKAIEVYDRLSEKDPQNAEYYYQRGMCHFNMQNYDLAVRDFRVATLSDNHHREAYYALAWVFFFLKNDPWSAKPHAKRADDLGHDNAAQLYRRIKDSLGLP